MSRDVCGICWCPYDEDGGCGCKPTQPEALRLADALDIAASQTDLEDNVIDVARWFVEDAAAELRRLHSENEALRYERDHARAHQMAANAYLTGIYKLLYPTVFTTPDGVAMAFRPKSIDPHELLQELSDRIRAVPDHLTAMKGQT